MNPTETLSSSTIPGLKLREGFAFFFGADCPFSQWHPMGFACRGRDFRTAEHWMMYCKAMLFGDERSAEVVLLAPTPREAKRLGRQVRGFDQRVWSERAPRLVEIGNRLKADANPGFANALLATDGLTLVEASPYDRIWGIGLGAHHEDAVCPERWPGQNLLGKALMVVRSELQREREFGQGAQAPAACPGETPPTELS